MISARVCSALHRRDALLTRSLAAADALHVGYYSRRTATAAYQAFRNRHGGNQARKKKGRLRQLNRPQ